MTATERHTPSVDEACECFVDGAAGEFIAEDFARMIEAVRAEEREKCAQIAASTTPDQGYDFEGYAKWGSFPNLTIAARIRAQGEEQGND